MTYEEIFSFESLYNAHMAARKNKRHKKDVIEFEVDLSSNLWALYDELASETYMITGYNRFIIYEPKQREIQALSYRDRIVQHALCDNYLYPFLTKRLVYDNAACQKGKGTDFAQKRLECFMRKFYKSSGTDGYMLKSDICHYFPSIDHEHLKSRLCKIIEDKKVMSLIEMIIDSFNSETGKGLPMGNQTSQMFALYYLDPLDRLIKERLHIKYYTRYMDDCILIHDDKRYLKYCLSKMEEMVEDELFLEFNNKTQIFPLKNGVDYLGFHFYITDTGKVIKKLRQSSKKRFKRRIKRLKHDYSSGEIELEDVKRSLAGYKGHLSRGHTHRLRQAVFKEFVLIRRL
jgi:RNA-directed DNA polymerase